MNDLLVWQVAVDAPIQGPLSYLPPLSPLAFSIQRGTRVLVPLGRRVVEGVVLNQIPWEKETHGEFVLKEIIGIDEQHDPLPEYFLAWLEWLAQYYIYPIGLVTSLAFPPLKKKLLKSKKKDSKRENAIQKAHVIPKPIQSERPHLTEEQRHCIDHIGIEAGFKVHLVFGVTGSGKTEIYLRLLEKVIQQNKKGIILVPEISLTPQLIQRFVNRFGDTVAALHSHLSDREKTDQWWAVIDGNKSILIGARSALFCPMKNLGLIIVDEEHEPSFKQDEKLKYHGRDAGIKLAQFANCPIVLGSATPSLESWKNAVEGRYQLHTLKKRVEGRSLPDIRLIDLRHEKELKNENALNSSKKTQLSTFWMSESMKECIDQALFEKSQVALFLNRRGLAQTIICPSCGHTVKCPNCEINLTLHAGSHLICHYCDYHENFKLRCSDCHEGERITIGLGTELIEQELRRLYPDKKVARADRDEIQNRADLESLISGMESGEIDILIGTQMIAKGLDFPKLKFVGLVLADVGFNIPDFRSTERSFHLITQMSGRSGRHVGPGESPGIVLIQCFNTQHPSIQFSLAHDYVGFASAELETRKSLGYPPFGKLIRFRIEGPHLLKIKQTVAMMEERCWALKNRYDFFKQVEILGPCPSAIPKLRNNYRYHLIIKCPDFRSANRFAQYLMGDESWISHRVKVLVDVDPVNLL